MTQPSLTGIYYKIIVRIITEQEKLVGNLAWEKAYEVPGLVIIDMKIPEIKITRDPKQVINALVEMYVGLFGKMARDVCRVSVLDITAELSPEEIPEELKLSSSAYYSK